MIIVDELFMAYLHNYAQDLHIMINEQISWCWEIEDKFLVYDTDEYNINERLDFCYSSILIQYVVDLISERRVNRIHNSRF